MIYCDTSLLVAAFTEERASAVAVEWLGRQAPGVLAISGWNLTEFASAIAMKRHRREIDDGEFSVVTRGWIELQARLRILAIPDTVFAKAAGLVDTPPRGLRAGDALHLAITLNYDCDIATFDHDLANAARMLGIAVHPASP